MRTFLFLLIIIAVTGCSSNRFFKKLSENETIDSVLAYAVLPNVEHLNDKKLEQHCQNQNQKNEIGLVLLLHCSEALLSRTNLSAEIKHNALTFYNDALYKLLSTRLGKQTNNVYLTLPPGATENVLFAREMQAQELSLTPKVFGDVGVGVVYKRNNSGLGQDKFKPLEGEYFASTLLVESIVANGARYEIILKQFSAKRKHTVMFGNNHFEVLRVPGAAFLALIENATIDDYSWLGFTSPSEAQKRRGVFAISDFSPDKTPIVMIHGLNSDPLIWRNLTMAMYNHPWLLDTHQIWHVYYPSGPPPFYNAMLIRQTLNQALSYLNDDKPLDEAIIIGHSMGGIISKLLSTSSQYVLWDETFNVRPEIALASENKRVKDVFIFEPVLSKNTVFFLDTPFKGSEIASSTIGYIGASLVELPTEFTGLFQRFIERVGPQILTDKMRPFLHEYGPNSVQVLRPGHPLMEKLYTLPVSGVAYAIVGSNGALTCKTDVLCHDISDGVVSFDSANYRGAKEKIIVPSSHNSFKSKQAIAFIINKIENNH